MTKFSLERNGQIINDNVHGFFCDKNHPDCIQVQGVDLVQIGDIIRHDATKQKFVVDKIHPLRSYAMLYCHAPGISPAPPSITIGTIAGNAIVGSQHSATINGLSSSEILAMIDTLQEISAEDKDKLKSLAFAVDSVVKAGLLERFSPILAAVLQPITAWLLPK